MSTTDVPGYKPANRDILAMGCWAEHDDGSLIFVEAVEGARVIYSIFDLAPEPPVEYRTAMPEPVFKKSYSWTPGDDNDGPTDSDDDDDYLGIVWTWHDKTPFPWDRIMDAYPEGQKHVSAAAQFTAAARVANSLKLRAEKIDVRRTRSGKSILERLNDALTALRK